MLVGDGSDVVAVVKFFSRFMYVCTYIYVTYYMNGRANRYMWFCVFLAN